MTPRDIRALYAVQQRGEAHIGVVATMMGVTKNVVSDQFRKLHAEGWLMRRPFGVQRAVYSLSVLGTKKLEEYLVGNPVPDLRPPTKAGTSVRAAKKRDTEEAQEERGQRATMRQYDWKSSAPFVPDMGAAQQRNDGNKHIQSRGFV